MGVVSCHIVVVIVDKLCCVDCRGAGQGLLGIRHDLEFMLDKLLNCMNKNFLRKFEAGWVFLCRFVNYSFLKH